MIHILKLIMLHFYTEKVRQLHLHQIWKVHLMMILNQQKVLHHLRMMMIKMINRNLTEKMMIIMKVRQKLNILLVLKVEEEEDVKQAQVIIIVKRNIIKSRLHEL